MENESGKQEKRENPLLAKLHKIPGVTFRLPSRGLFYKNGELDPEVEDGEVVVHSMTAVDELVMKSPDMLFQGTAITQTILRCVPQIRNAEDLLVHDVDFLLTCLRKVSYGPNITLTHKCKLCKDPKEIEYQIPLSHFIQNTKELTEEDFKNMRFNLADMYDVRLKPCTFMQMIKVIQAGEKLNATSTSEEIMNWVNQSLAAVIKVVDSISAPEDIIEWLSALPVAMRTTLSESVANLNKWGPEFKYTTKCLTCKKEIEFLTNVNPTSFFMQPSS
jgi:hypothetical protein